MPDKKENIRELLLQTAQSLVEDKGAEYLTARKLSEASGCSVGTIYNQFASMDELFASLNIATLADLQTAMKRVAVGPNAYKNLNAWLDSFVSFVLANPNRWILLYNYHLRGGHLSATYRQQIISLTQMWQKSFDAVYAHLNARKRRLARQVLWLSLFALSSFLTTKVIDNLSMVNKKNLCKLLLNTYLAGIAVLKKG